MPRTTNWASAKTPPTRQQRQTTHLGELDTTPTRPDASPGLFTKDTPQNGVYEQSIRLNKDSDAFEDGLEDGDLVKLVDTQAVPNATVSKDFPWSETGSGARRSSVTENQDLYDANLAFRSSVAAHHRQMRDSFFFACFWTLVLFLVVAMDERRVETGRTVISSIPWVALMGIWVRFGLEAWRGDNRY
ncbi:hypothetical protein E4U22_007308 [Claviceps purpurea]|nr:hypothetical protein E4U28_008183 [Claviceps purpurea]KAG6270817.1 hypothetical protein E4U48_003669 [Claviceps purpurea]KAG6301848.1 hypothetical protein E4U45_003113 [Claviceps purpurea]KAG6316110.1 hypothetical protein E4U22_007308 [Claviceps purpurea]